MTSLWSRGSRAARIVMAAAGLLILGGLGVVAGVYLAFLRDLPDLKSVADYRPALASRVLDRNGELIGLFFTERRRLVHYGDVPERVVQAFVAGEDSTFFEHAGIDFQSILRAAWVNLRAGGETRQGGSTITQQVVKGLLLTPERTYRRKIREMILARRLEQRLTKPEILELYLNQIYLGHGAYGIGEAAWVYFGKQVGELSVSEGAQLAGLPKAPTRYSPFGNPEEAEQRRLYVLARMHEEGFLDAEAHALAALDRPVLVEQDPDREAFEAAAYFTEEVRRYLFDALGGDAVLQGGLRVETTLDLALQRSAVAALRQGLEDLDRRQGFRGALRRVPADGIEAEIARLAAENGLAGPEPGPGSEMAEPADPEADPEGAAAALPATPAPAAATAPGVDPDPEAQLALLRERLARRAPLLGVVTEVRPEDALARVAFAPQIPAVVRLADVAWARDADSRVAPAPVKKISQVFRVGDVAKFDLLPPEEKAVPEGSPARGALLATLHQEPLVQGALLSLEVPSGEVLALVGGYDFATSQFDRVTQARRQPGSAFKPIVYGAALSLRDPEGQPLYTPASIVHDRPKVYVDESSGLVWRPENYGRRFYGPITLRKALAKSVNNAAVHLCDQVGVGRVIDFARRLGIRSPLERSLALALGSSEVTLLELTRAYATFPAGGRRVVPHFIRRVLDRDGELLLENVVLGDAPELQAEESPGNGAAAESASLPESVLLAAAEPEAPAEAEADPDQLLAPENAYLMTDMLRAVVLEGTGWRLRKLGRPVAGKTGTTNDQADAWFMGFSPEITTGVWVGHDEIRFLGWGETGSQAAAPIWVDFMREALAGRPKRDFPTPDSIVFTRIDRETGLLATSGTQETVFQAFIAGSEPTETAERQRNTSDALRDLREDSLSEDGAGRLMQLDAF